MLFKNSAEELANELARSPVSPTGRNKYFRKFIPKFLYNIAGKDLFLFSPFNKNTPIFQSFIYIDL